MANKLRLLLRPVAVLLVLSASLPALLPSPVLADGGPWVGSDLWAYLTEGQQVAVITAQNDDSVKVDLFVSILDRTSQSHEISFFVPLGTKASNFYVVEGDVVDFDDETTEGLDDLLSSSSNRKHAALTTLFVGTVLANGYIMAPFWAPLMLSGCAGNEPIATFSTSSSVVSIYEIDDDTDAGALVAATGLPEAVKSTLERLRGQQIAVVKMQTKPQGSGSGSGYYGSNREPGIHLSWVADLVSGANGNTFSYSLGTGEAWAKPIEMTRVYVVTPPGLDFNVKYPRLGVSQSGHTGLFGNPRIASYYQVPAYAVDEARGNFGRVWRVTYTQSNPKDDILLTFKKQSAWSSFRAAAEENAVSIAFVFALVVAPLLWIAAWTLLMPRLVKRRENLPALRWYQSLIYPGINAALIVFPGTILFFVLTLGLVIPTLIMLFLLFGGAALFAFWLIHSRRLGVSVGRALGAFVIVSLAANAAYLLLALPFAKLVGII